MSFHIVSLAARIAQLNARVLANEPDRIIVHGLDSQLFDALCNLQDKTNEAIKGGLSRAKKENNGPAVAVLEDELTRRAYAGEL